MTLPALFTSLRSRIDEQLLLNLPTSDDVLAQAMRYSVCNGGKRIRPMLVYAVACGHGVDVALADQAACAVEYIHAYSLVHDDLPAMDNDALRRGKPTCHIAFDEATAILVGDALHSLAFECITKTSISAVKIVKMSQVLSHAIGHQGMAGGQSLDLAATGKSLTLENLAEIHHKKTGALLVASITLGTLISGCDDRTTQQLVKFAEHVGLAFQIQDDLLDVHGTTEKIGKTVGSDQALNKPTYAKFYSAESGVVIVSELFAQGRAALHNLPLDTKWLLALADYLEMRTY